MHTQDEKLWDYDGVTPGQTGTPTEVAITPENIRDYAIAAQNHDVRYMQPGQHPAYPDDTVAMPTMVLDYAPLLRWDIASNNGFVALEESATARRQTPFAKCDIRWYQPVMAGDTITGTRRVLEKYERRGSRFVTFRVVAYNQREVLVARFDYTCIFSYGQGQKHVPTSSERIAVPEVQPGYPVADAPQPLTFDRIKISTSLPRLRVAENQAIINRKNDFRLAGKALTSNIHTDDTFARNSIFGGLVNAGPATMSYVDQMLQLAFPLPSFYNGGGLLMRAIEPFRAGDVVTFEGEVTDKQIEGKRHLVSCRVKGLNQRGDLVSLSDATLNLLE